MARGFGATVGAGTSDKITSALTSHSTTRTYSFWFKNRASGGGSNMILFAKNASGIPVEYFYWHTSDRYHYSRVWTSGDSEGLWRMFPPGAGHIGVWHHCMFSYDSSSPSNDPIFYLDGSLATQDELLTPGGTVVNDSEAYRIGNRGNSDIVWDGEIAEWAVWDSIRSSGDASSLWNSGSGRSAMGIHDGSLVEYIRMHDDPVTSLVLSNPTVSGTAQTTHPFFVSSYVARRAMMGIG